MPIACTPRASRPARLALVVARGRGARAAGAACRGLRASPDGTPPPSGCCATSCGALARRQAREPCARVLVDLGRLLLGRGRAADAQRAFADARAAAEDGARHQPGGSRRRSGRVGALTDAARLDDARRACRTSIDHTSALERRHRAWADACAVRRGALARRRRPPQRSVSRRGEPHDDAPVGAWIEAMAVRALLASPSRLRGGPARVRRARASSDGRQPACASRPRARPAPRPRRSRRPCRGRRLPRRRSGRRTRGAARRWKLARATLIWVGAAASRGTGRRGRRRAAPSVPGGRRGAAAAASCDRASGAGRHGDRGERTERTEQVSPVVAHAGPSVAGARNRRPERRPRRSAPGDRARRRGAIRGADRGRERSREGTRGARAPSSQPARGAPILRPQLRRAARRSGRGRALRARARRLHRRARRSRGPVRGGERRHALPRRSVGALAARAGQAAACASSSRKCAGWARPQTRPVDVRIVAAANRSMADEVAAGRFRADLLYRLDVDAPAGAAAARAARRRAGAGRDLLAVGGRAGRQRARRSATAVLRALARYAWPGNVRELQNVMAALVVAAPSRGRVPPSLLPPRIRGAQAPRPTLADVRDRRASARPCARRWRVPAGAAPVPHASWGSRVRACSTDARSADLRSRRINTVQRGEPMTLEAKPRRILRVLRYLARRLVLTIPVLLGVATLVFSLIHLIPGDPAQAMLGETAPQADVDELRRRLGLDRPLLEQYGAFLSGLVRGRSRHVAAHRRAGGGADGDARAGHARSWRRRRCSWRWPSRCRSGLPPPCGAAPSSTRGAMALALAGVSIPNFWLGPLLAIVFADRAGVAAGVGARHARRIWCCRRSRLAARWRRSWRG